MCVENQVLFTNQIKQMFKLTIKMICHLRFGFSACSNFLSEIYYMLVYETYHFERLRVKIYFFFRMCVCSLSSHFSFYNSHNGIYLQSAFVNFNFLSFYTTLLIWVFSCTADVLWITACDVHRMHQPPLTLIHSIAWLQILRYHYMTICLKP